MGWLGSSNVGTEWPKFSWDLPADKRSEWLFERVIEIARLARAFEMGFEEAAQREEIQIEKAELELNDWDICASRIYRYTGIGDGAPVPSDVAGFSKEVRAVYAELGLRRKKVLQKWGGSGVKAVCAHEASAEVDVTLLRSPPPSPAAALPPPTSLLGDNFSQTTGFSIRRTVTADEVRARQVAENKPMPDKHNLAAMLAYLPSDWVGAVFKSLGLKVSEEDELSAGSRSSILRGLIHRSLFEKDSLAKVFARLDAEQRALLRDVLAAGGQAPYKRIGERYGHDESDGFHWSERAPSGPLSGLRRLGLVYVGAYKSMQVVVIPTDMRALVQELLSEAPGPVPVAAPSPSLPVPPPAPRSPAPAARAPAPAPALRTPAPSPSIPSRPSMPAIRAPVAPAMPRPTPGRAPHAAEPPEAITRPPPATRAPVASRPAPEEDVTGPAPIPDGEDIG